MSFRVELTFRAERDLDQILGWLQGRSSRGAATWFRRWKKVLSDLSTKANILPYAPENENHEEEIRNVVFKTRRGLSYRALFIIRDQNGFRYQLTRPRPRPRGAGRYQDTILEIADNC